MRRVTARLVLVSATYLAAAGMAWGAMTDPINMPGAIKGTMDIKFDTRTTLDDTGKVPAGSPALETTDTYKVDLTIMDSLILKGDIYRQPWLPTSKLGRTKQEGYLAYNLRCRLKNPQKPDQVLDIGGWIGATRVDGQGMVFLDEPIEGKGPLRFATDSVGKITGFTSNFTGKLQGKVPEKAGLWGLADRMTKKVTKQYTRIVGGKQTTINVVGADPVEFKPGTTLAQGPLSFYPTSRLSGSMNYDGESGNWYVEFGVTYTEAGKAYDDKYTGTIRWTEDPNRESNGMGAYMVNVRVNEQPSEGDAFSCQGEDCFFAADNSVPGFTGVVNYVDSFDGETVVASKVVYAIDANQVSKIQTMNLAKILLLIVGPFNDE